MTIPHIYFEPVYEVLSLPVRVDNALKNDCIDYIGDLVTLSPDFLMRIPNFGRKSLKDLEKEMAANGLSLSTPKIEGWEEARAAHILRERIRPLEAQWYESLTSFMNAYERADRDSLTVPPEIYDIAPLAAKFIAARGYHSLVVKALLVPAINPDIPALVARSRLRRLNV